MTKYENKNALKHGAFAERDPAETAVDGAAPDAREFCQRLFAGRDPPIFAQRRLLCAEDKLCAT
jgi:hypothetical protein